MSALIPKSLEDLIEALKVLPGVGTRSAERYAYYLLKSDPAKSKKLADSLLNLHSGVSYCKKTFALVPSGQELSRLYTDSERDKTVVAVVAEPLDVIALESTGAFKGTYHVLGGLLSPIEGIGPENLRVQELVDRIDEDKVKEIILATSASVEGESTAYLIKRSIEGKDVQLTRLAQGLPIGTDIEYADQVTLSRALENRRVFASEADR